MTDEAFVESAEEPVVRGKRVSLPLTEDGTFDWDNASDKHKRLFIQAIKADPNGILQNIQEEAATPSAESGIADATVVATVNALFAVEAIGFTTIGARFAPVLRNLHPIVAISACTVTEEEMAPVMPAAKRIVAEYMPPELGKYQDLIVVGQHLLKLSAAKFKHCIDLAMEIERVKASGQSPHAATQNGPNGKVISGEGQIR